MMTPPLYVFFSHTTPFQFIMTPPNYKVELYRQPPLLIIPPPPTIRVRRVTEVTALCIYVKQEDDEHGSCGRL